MRKKLSKISSLHFVKLILRSLLLLAAVTTYVLERTEILTHRALLPIIVWVFFVVEMLLRFFPSRLESMGCQKQFAKNYEPVETNGAPKKQVFKGTALVALVWLALNTVFGVLYLTGVLEAEILVLISIAYSVCDIICILFFCPFQTWFMKNRCCATCRIYNWDYAMMLTPLVFVPSVYTYSLLACALALLLRWEITFHRHPERFGEETNKCLDCARCEEKLCSHKKQLKGFLQKYKTRFFPPRETKQKK